MLITVENFKYKIINRDKCISVLVQYSMDNPCLSRDIDYSEEEERLSYYTNQYKEIEDRALLQEVIDSLNEDYLDLWDLIDRGIIGRGK
jgi:hypothetical protein